MAPGLDPYDLANPYWQAVAKVLANHIKDLLKQHPDGLELHSGMALGADTIWAKVIVAARKHYGFNKIKFVADCPLPTQPSRWPKTSQQTWQKLVDQADVVNYVTKGQYYPAVMEERNQMMINPSDECIAFWSGSKTGGTANGVRDARQNQVKIWHITPQQPNKGEYI